jgi:hypothetical protein
MALITKWGSEYKALLGSSIVGVTMSVGLFRNATDQLTYQHDLGNINTEPADGNYARQSITTEMAEGTKRVIIRNSAAQTFDLTNTTNQNGQPDSYFIVVSYQSTIKGETQANDHLLGYGRLRDAGGETTIDLDNTTSWDLLSGMAAFEM